MDPPWHFADPDVRIRKLCVGPLENNVYVVACPRTDLAVVIDAAAEPERIVAACSDVSPVAVLTTHGHRDHVGAAAEVGDTLGIGVRIHAADTAMAGIESGNPLDDGERISVGGVTLTAVHTPGHTPGSTCFTLPGHVFSGDTLFPGGPGATRNADDFARIVASLRSELFSLPDDTLVHPGHGLDTTIGTERPALPEWVARGW